MKSSSGNRLGDFLRARRARLSPDEMGLAVMDGRRVRGLRREEVAVLAGVSVDYYARMEQGRERTPSAQVVEAIAGALRLDSEARDYLYRLARLAPVTLRAAERVTEELQQTIDAFPHAAAIVVDTGSRIVAANPLGRALFSPAAEAGSLIEGLFLAPDAQRFFVDWETAARAEVCRLKFAMSYTPPPRDVAALVERLGSRSEAFRRIWAEEDVVGDPVGQRVIDHPVVGLVRLALQRFDVRAAPGLEMLVFSAVPSSQSAAALRRLAQIAERDAAVDASFAVITSGLDVV